MMMISLLAIFAIALCVTAACFDFMALKLPNYLMVALLAVYAQIALISHFNGEGQIISQLMTGIGLFILTGILFFTGIFGGGDAKMISIVGLFIGLQGLPSFLLVMSLAGFMLALTAYILRRPIKSKRFYKAIPKILRPQNGWLHSLHKGENAIPYGIAITAGVIVSFTQTGIL